MNKKILVSAFGPFGSEGYNPSEKLLGNLSGDIIKIILPVTYSGAAERLKSAISEHHPDFVICLGLAGGRSEVCLEACALNVMDASIPDNAGYLACGEPFVPGSENARFTSLPLRNILSKVKAAGIPCRISYHAGTYVCNSTYYTLLESGTPGCFIHIPYDEKSVEGKRGDTPFIKLSDSALAVSTVIDFLKEL